LADVGHFESLRNFKPPAAWRRIADAGIQRVGLMSLGSSGNATIRRPQDVHYGAESTV